MCDIIRAKKGDLGGILPSEDSRPVQVPEGGGYLLGWGHLASSFYKCHSEDPCHAMVQLSIARGIPHTRIWVFNIPRDAVEFIADKGNRFHGGANWTFLQQFDSVKPLEAKWVLYKANHGITSRSLPASGAFSYENVYWHWIQEKTDHFDSWMDWDDTKSTYRKLQRQGAWDLARDTASKHCDFLHGHFAAKKSNREVVILWHAINVAMIPYIETMEPTMWAKLFANITRFSHFNTDEKTKPVLHTNAKAKLKNLACPMTTSIIYNREAKEATKTPKGSKRVVKKEEAEEKQEKETEPAEAQPSEEVAELQVQEKTEDGDAEPTEPATKKAAIEAAAGDGPTPRAKKGKAKVKAKAKANAKAQATIQDKKGLDAQEGMELQVTTKGSLRDKHWVEDLVTMICSVTGSIAKYNSSLPKSSTRKDIDWASVDTCMLTAFEFAFEKSTTFRGTEFKTWSSLRKTLKDYLSTKHDVQHLLEEADKIVNTNIEQALQQEAKDQPALQRQRSHDELSKLSNDLEALDFVFQTKSILDGWSASETVLEKHPLYHKAISKLDYAIKQLNQEISPSQSATTVSLSASLLRHGL